MSKLEQMQERARKDIDDIFFYEYELSEGFERPIGSEPSTRKEINAEHLGDVGRLVREAKDKVDSLITEVWNEAELSGKVQALHAMEDIYHKANDKADLMEMTNEALLPKADITSDKTPKE